MKKRVLLPPAMRSPKLDAIRAAVEEVAAERERLTGKKKARRYRRKILEPAVRSPHREAIEAAVEAVIARRSVAGQDPKE